MTAKYTLPQLHELTTYYQHRPAFNAAAEDVSFVQSEAFQDQLESASIDPHLRAEWTINLLKHIALDPHQGTRLGDFLTVSANQELVFVNLRLHRTSNFLGYFELAATSPYLAKLATAISENLDSKLFKAAALYRKLQASSRKRFNRCEAIAYRARKLAELQAEASIPALPASAYPERQMERSRAISAISQEAFDIAYTAAKERVFSRLHNVSQQAFSPAYRGSAHEIMLAYITDYVRPASSYMC